MRKLLIGVGVVIAWSGLGLIAPAYADAVFKDGNHPCAVVIPGTIDCKGTEQNVLFKIAQGPVNPGTAIVGHTDHSDTAVDFVSTVDHLKAKGGQSDLGSASGLIHNVTISLPGGTLFGDLIINPFKDARGVPIDISVKTSTGTFTDALTPESGNNFLTIRASDFTNLLKSVTINDTSGFANLDQTRISGIEGVPPVPEPSTFLLVGSGLLAFLLIRKKGRLVRFET